MQKFIFVYRLPVRYVPTPETTAEMKEWFGRLGEDLVQLGQPVVASGAVGACSSDAAEFAGYSIIQARNLPAALAIAEECPHLRRGGGIEVGLLGEVPARVDVMAGPDETSS